MLKPTMLPALPALRLVSLQRLWTQGSMSSSPSFKFTSVPGAGRDAGHELLCVEDDKLSRAPRFMGERAPRQSLVDHETAAACRGIPVPIPLRIIICCFCLGR
ncbi:hypothetical protein DFP72DRAFT_920345 [Ephemerocybe angulata]|uniref:Uncharacterized protein n=1 Tax=Ephemerocybe angulata TaxID=980116 RepID=A0A8H6HHP9_9AGAR|nr:hypothetical protein DFP72DRAFT_920345 [Tulosesus angulatus]